MQLYKLAVARSDICEASSLCDLFIEIGLTNKKNAVAKHEIRDALISAILISYSRPFTDNQPYGPLQKKWFKFDNPSFNELHKRIINYRNKIIAHSDYDIRKVYLYPQGYQDKDLRGCLLISNKPFPIEEIKTIKVMCDDLRIRFSKEISILTRYVLTTLPFSSDPIEILSGLTIE